MHTYRGVIVITCVCMYDAHGARVVHGVARPSSMRAIDIDIEIEIEIEIAKYLRPSSVVRRRTFHSEGLVDPIACMRARARACVRACMCTNAS